MFFVVSGDHPALLGMPDIELLTCDIKCGPHDHRKFDSQTIETSNSPNEAPQIKTDRGGIHGGKTTCQIISNLLQIK